MTAVSSALIVLECVARSQPIGLSEISRELSLPKSTVQRSLKELAAQDWIEQESTGSRWVQSAKMLTLARHDGNRGLRSHALPAMRLLLQQVDENVHLSVRSGLSMSIVEKLESSKTVRPFDPLGVASPMHTTSSGKAVLAWAPSDEVEFYLSTGMQQFAGLTPAADPAELRDELAQIRECGYALNRGQWRPEVLAAAAPLFVDDSPPSAAISVAVPVHRMTLQDLISLGELIARTVNPPSALPPRRA